MSKPSPTEDAAAAPGNGEEFLECSDAARSASVDRVAVRLPPFWAEDAEIWFAQVEAQFEMSGIKSDATKYYQVIRELDHKTAREVRDIITRPPATDKYNKLKSELINRLSVSREQRMRQLLTHEELGDRKPSQFLRHLRALAGDSVGDEFLRSLWSSRLPTHIQAIIASQKDTMLDQVAILADQICDVAPSPIYHQQVASTDAFEGMIQRLEQSITTRVQNEISQQIAQLNIQTSNRNGASPSQVAFIEKSNITLSTIFEPHLDHLYFANRADSHQIVSS
ncbi:uncharacterized protein LOC135076733 [Ostrinia nubilalis]|uniref:uncharacterized protein LOC135076733 n=1 Tax=Ostrinia nubilalis TaxID=29057 RepID=UPI0030824E0E